MRPPGARALACALSLAPLGCAAHGLGSGGLVNGLLHPIGGADHMLAMLGVGIVSAKLGGRWLWLLPSIFLAAMAGGFSAGLAHPTEGARQASEWGILLSVLLLGVLTSIPKEHVPRLASLAATALFGFAHGHAHGTELPGQTSPWAFSAGFLLASAGFHVMGAIVGLLCEQHRKPARNFAAVGAFVGLTGAVLAARAGL